MYYGQDAGITAPAGWTQIDYASEASPKTNAGHRLHAWYRVAGESEPSTYTWSMDNTDRYSALAIACYSGGDGAPLDVSNFQFNGTNTTMQSASITTTVADALVVFLGCAGQGFAWSNTPPSGFTERIDFQVNWRNLYLADKTQGSAGATGAVSVTLAQSRVNWGALVSFKPPAPARAGGAAIIVAPPARRVIAPSPAIIVGRPRRATRRAAGSIIVAPPARRVITPSPAIIVGRPRGATTVTVSASDAAALIDAATPARTSSVADTATLSESASITIFEPTEYRLFETATGPAALSDTYAISLALEFYSDQDCEVTKLHYWRGASDVPSGQAGRIYAVGNATPLASVNFSDSGTGWQTATLGTPLTITGGQRYYVVVYFPTGRFSSTANYFDTGAGAGGKNNGVLHAPNDAGATQGQMPFSFGIDAYPYSSAIAATFYWVDVTIRANVIAKAGNETFTVTDGATVNVVVSASDTISATDSTALARGVADTATLTEGATVTVVVSASDTVTTTSATGPVRNSSASDILTLTHISTLSVALASPDGASLIDAVTALARVTFDGATATDAGSLATPKVGGETFTLTEGATVTVVVSASDTITTIDTPAPVRGSSVTDTATGADTAQAPNVAFALADAFALTDTVSIFVALIAVDSLAATDTAQPAGAVLGVADGATLTESASLVVSLAAADTIPVTESASIAAALSRTDLAGLAEASALFAALAGVDMLSATGGRVLETGDDRIGFDTINLAEVAAVRRRNTERLRGQLIGLDTRGDLTPRDTRGFPHGN